MAPKSNPSPTYLTITKNPTDENRKTGGTALFVANATIFDILTWTLVAPNGCDCTVYYTQYSDGSYDITSVDIYGGAYDYDGGWAGSSTVTCPWMWERSSVSI